jgi:hypothetical protein
MRPCRSAILAAIGCLAILSVQAMGTMEKVFASPPEVLRYPVAVGLDGRLTVLASGGSKGSRLSLPQDTADGYRFSFRGSYYEIVTYPSGRYAVLSLDRRKEGKSHGHSLFLDSRSEPDRPIPEWVTDDRSLLSGLSQYSGFVALRYSKKVLTIPGKLTAEEVLNKILSPLALLGMSNPSDRDSAAAEAIAEDLAALLAPSAEFSTYWMKFLKGDAAGGPRYSSLTVEQKAYGLVLVPDAVYVDALRKLREAYVSGTVSYPSPNIEAILKALYSVLPREEASPAPMDAESLSPPPAVIR